MITIKASKILKIMIIIFTLRRGKMSVPISLQILKMYLILPYATHLEGTLWRLPALSTAQICLVHSLHLLHIDLCFVYDCMLISHKFYFGEINS